ncbi:MAG: 50S ribosomal protein L29 [bacterium]
MKAQEIRDLNVEEIDRKAKELKESLFKIRMKLSTKQVENTAQINVIKKDIARLLTIAKQKRAVKGAVK